MIRWTSNSEKDLDFIREHIAKNFNVDLAISTVNELVEYVESTLGQNPLAGSILESNPFFSKLIFEGNSIFYCENPQNRHIYVVYVQARGSKFKKHRLSSK